MAGRYTPARGLDVRVARNVVGPNVRRIQGELADALRRTAPPGRVWVTAHDERVRPTHRDADGQLIPGNLRFVIKHPHDTGKEMAQAPRDPNLSEANRLNCRCVDVEIPAAVAEKVQQEDVQQRGARVVGTVSIVFPRIVESEHPGLGERGGGWVRQAIDEVTVRLSARR